MFTEDTDLSHVPWQLLIRARTVAEVDAVVSSVVLGRLAEVASVEVIRRVATAATEAAGVGAGERATPEHVLGALGAAADFDDWFCGTPPRPRPWPHRGDLLDEVSDPITPMVVAGALRLVEAGGSDALQKTLGQVLAEVGRRRTPAVRSVAPRRATRGADGWRAGRAWL